jgi:hypothetical protein
VSRAFVLTVLLAVAAGCGGTAQHAAAPTKPARPNPYPDDPTLVERATTPAQRAALARAAHDVDAMKRAAAATSKRSLKGTPRLRRTTALFLQHMQTSPLESLTQNRLIDHAAAAVAFACEQCFQQLEANRPIPQIAHH